MFLAHRVASQSRILVPFSGTPNATTTAGASVIPGTAPEPTAPSSTQTSPRPSNTKRKHVGAIVGGVISGVVALLLLLGAFFFTLRRVRARRTSNENGGDYISEVRRSGHPHRPVLTPFEGGHAASMQTRSFSSKAAEASLQATDATSSMHDDGQPAPWLPLSEEDTISVRGPASQGSLPVPSGAQAPATAAPAMLQILESLQNEVRQVRSLALGNRAGWGAGTPPPDYD